MLMKRFISFLVLALITLKSSFVFSGYDDGVSTYMYNGIPGCACFYHCKCFKSLVDDNWDYVYHPSLPEDQLWHKFMHKVFGGLTTKTPLKVN